MLDLSDISSVHMIGIGGIGMSALAHALHDRGILVTGSDVAESQQVQRLRRLGMMVHIGHDAGNVNGAELVVHSSAIRPDNCEMLAAGTVGIPIIHRSELLALFLQDKRAVAVAGTHGKTTTTAMLSLILLDAGLDPTVFLGGVSLDFGDNYRLGASDLVVFEADESDASFCRYGGCWQIVTNVDKDHLDRHQNLENIRRLFGEFISIGDPDGFLIYGSESNKLPALARRFPGQIRSFGVGDAQAFYRAENLRSTEELRSLAEVVVDGQHAGELSLGFPGRHNVGNALAAIGLAHSMGVPVEASLQSLARFSGTERRFQLLYHRDKLRIYDDYAHHPAEVEATLDGARDFFPDDHLTAIFQPHLPSRTKLLLNDFATSVGNADAVIINSIYAAREEQIDGLTAEAVADSIRKANPGKPVHHFEDQDELMEFVWTNMDAQELVMVMGAGDICHVGRSLADRLMNGHG